ncbi:MAG: rod-binding protein [Magnetospirillum sp. WYHS-4]
MADMNFAAEARNALDRSRQGAPSVAQKMTLEKARKTAQDFETFFLAESLKPMFENLDAEEPFGGGHAEQMWKSMQVDEYAKAISKRGGVGIADAVLEQMVRMQENSHGRQ